MNIMSIWSLIMSISSLPPLFPQEKVYIGVVGAAIFGVGKKEGQMKLHLFCPPQKFDNIVQQDMMDVSSSSRLYIQQITTEI